MARDRSSAFDDPAQRVRDARRAFGASIATTTGLSVLLTLGVAMLIATIPSLGDGTPWTDALPRLSLNEALTLITVFLVVYGLGVVREPERVRQSSPDDTAASMAGQQLREIAVIAGWAGTTIALWAAVDAQAEWQAAGHTAGESAGRLVAALMAGALMASLAALVPIRYPPHIQALVDEGRRANEKRILEQLHAWGLSREQATVVRRSLRARATRLVLPMLGQTFVPCALIIGILAMGRPEHAARSVGLGVAAYVFTAIGTVTLIAPFAFFRSVPRTPILGTASVVYPVLWLLLSLGFVLSRWGQAADLALWCAPMLVVGLRLGISLVVWRSGPAMVRGPWSVVDRRWWVAAYLETSQPVRIATATMPPEPDPRGGYM
ncbi:hypothetical protein [Cellulomonas iranensis]|uniref:hypothetical protein n=1 Tax=Cellulomonas iranensis TaxID=76862 RepID=UPI000B3C77FC|nr:hypothetical protein [Cellulomonas iranensis]